MTLHDALTAASDAVEAFLFDDPTVAETVTITRDPENTADDVLDPNTLELVPPDGDATVIYQGPALVSPDSTRTEPGVEGGAGAYPDAYKARLPLDCPTLQIGDRLSVDASPDPNLTGRVFTVDAVPSTGRRVTTRVSLHATVTGPRR